MMFEKGNKATSYIGGCIEKYRQDNMIFIKALQVIQTYSIQAEWPHNYNDMKTTLQLILEDDLDAFRMFFDQYLYARTYLKATKIEWPEDLPEKFSIDAEIFYRSTRDFLSRSGEARVRPMQFYKLVTSTVAIGGKPKKVFKFIRMDGESLDIEMSREDIMHLQESLGIVIQDQCELE